MRLHEFQIQEGKHDPHIFKAIFLAGGPGSGKSYVGNKIIAGSGIRTVSSDHFYEMLMKQSGKDLSTFSQTDQGDEFHKGTKQFSSTKMDLLIDGRIGLLVDGTGRQFDKIKKSKERLEALGYETIMILVNTNLETAIKRNDTRERKVNIDYLTRTHNEARDNIGKFQALFGEKFIVVDNSEDTSTDFDVLWKRIRHWLDKPVNNEYVKQWMAA